ncbi:MAG: hypothetical protein IPM98_11615 [Lewinellaceae bacterium]|nr:hypothetical protein [Lewinellaceae bacterium]
MLFRWLFRPVAIPDLSRGRHGALKMDGIVGVCGGVFPLGAGLLVTLGLLSAGLSTLEGLSQALSTTSQPT